MTIEENLTNRTQEPLSANSITLTVEEAQHIAGQLQLKGVLPQAERLYRQIIASEPDNQITLYFLSGLCCRQNQTDEALSLIERVIALDPGNADAHSNRGIILERLGRSGEAQASYRTAVAVNPDHAPAHNHLGVQLSVQGKTDEAIELYRRAVELAPDAADYRYNLGRALRSSGDLQGAVDAYRGTLERNLHHSGAWEGLAWTFILADRRDLARQAYEDWQRVEPDNPAIGFLLSACTGEGVPSRAPESYVRKLFDSMADTFDSRLAHLEYKAPELLCKALAASLGTPDGSLDILDAGCGTGLCGVLLRPFARHLAGVDLSPGMLAMAAARNIYDDLFQAELTTYMGSHSDRYDVIASADTFCYFGDLNPVFEAAAGALHPGGYLAFTLEDGGNDGEEPKLHLKERYMHPLGYVERSLAAFGLVVLTKSAVFLRNEEGKPVAGHLVVAQKLLA